MKRIFPVILVWLASMSVFASEPTSVYVAEVRADFETTYKNVYKSLEDNRFFVVFEPDIGANLSRFGKNWGDDYNKNNIERIKSMVFCNGWYANQVSNADPDMLGLCPLHITMTHKAGVTKILFVRPDFVARGTKAEKIAGELAQGVIEAINKGIK